MVFPNKNGYGRTYFRECFCYLVSINGVPCSCLGDETDASEVCRILRESLSVYCDSVDIDYKPIRFFSSL